MEPLVADIHNSRCFNAPIQLVWELWSNPEHLAQWWGPRGFRNTFHVHEFKPGGQWRFIMHGPDGVDYPNEMVYLEIEPHAKIVLEHVCNPKFTATILFEPQGNRTWVHFYMKLNNPAIAEAIKDYAILGNEQNFERLEAALAAQTGLALPEPFVLSRTFNTAVDRMWEMWTNPTHMSQWWGPKEVTVGYSKMDFKRGGFHHYAMVNPDGSKMWGKMAFKDIVRNKRLMFINMFSNEQGEITAHPMAPQWPKEILSTVTFDGNETQTTVTIEWVPINATLEEILVFNQAHQSMTEGWSGSLTRLEKVLEAYN